MRSRPSWTGAACRKRKMRTMDFTGNTGGWYMLENCPGSMVGRQVAGNAGCGDSGYPWAAQAGDG